MLCQTRKLVTKDGMVGGEASLQSWKAGCASVSPLQLYWMYLTNKEKEYRGELWPRLGLESLLGSLAWPRVPYPGLGSSGKQDILPLDASILRVWLGSL